MDHLVRGKVKEVGGRAGSRSLVLLRAALAASNADVCDTQPPNLALFISKNAKMAKKGIKWHNAAPGEEFVELAWAHIHLTVWPLRIPSGKGSHTPVKAPCLPARRERIRITSSTITVQGFLFRTSEWTTFGN